jgi:hypothetical protein
MMWGGGWWIIGVVVMVACMYLTGRMMMGHRESGHGAHRDHPDGIRELKAKAGGELQLHGSGALFRWLLDNDPVDEINLLTVPVVVGQGTRLVPDTGPDIALDLVDSRAFPKGITIRVYRPPGARSMQRARHEARDIAKGPGIGCLRTAEIRQTARDAR